MWTEDSRGGAQAPALVQRWAWSLLQAWLGAIGSKAGRRASLVVSAASPARAAGQRMRRAANKDPGQAESLRVPGPSSTVRLIGALEWVGPCGVSPGLAGAAVGARDAVGPRGGCMARALTDLLRLRQPWHCTVCAWGGHVLLGTSVLSSHGQRRVSDWGIVVSVSGWDVAPRLLPPALTAHPSPFPGLHGPALAAPSLLLRLQTPQPRPLSLLVPPSQPRAGSPAP